MNTGVLCEQVMNVIMFLLQCLNVQELHLWILCNWMWTGDQSWNCILDTNAGHKSFIPMGSLFFTNHLLFRYFFKPWSILEFRGASGWPLGAPPTLFNSKYCTSFQDICLMEKLGWRCPYGSPIGTPTGIASVTVYWSLFQAMKYPGSVGQGLSDSSRYSNFFAFC